MSDPMQRVAQDGLAKAVKEYWINREPRQIEAAEAAFVQLDTLVKQSATPGEVEALRLIEAAAQATRSDPATRLAVQQEGLAVLAAGAAAGPAAQLPLAARLIRKARKAAPTVWNELQSMAPAWGADGKPLLEADAWIAAADRRAPIITATLDSLLRAPDDTTRAAAQAMEAASGAAARAAVARAALSRRTGNAATLLAEARKAGHEDAVAPALLAAIAEGTRLDAAGRLAVYRQALREARSSGKPCAEWLAAQAVATPGAGPTAAWQDALRQGLQVPPAAREAFCAALLGSEAEAPDARALADACAAAIREVADPQARIAVATVALHALPQTADREWGQAIQAAVQAEPQSLDGILSCLAKEGAPENAPDAAAWLQSLLRDAYEEPQRALHVVRALTPALVQQANRDGHADGVAAATLIEQLVQLPWVDPRGSLDALEAALDQFPQPSDETPPPPPDTRTLAALGKAAAEHSNTCKDHEQAAACALQAVASTAAARGESNAAAVAQALSAATAAMPDDHAQRAILLTTALRTVADTEEIGQATVPALLHNVIHANNLTDDTRVHVLRAVLEAEAKRGGAADADLLARMAALDLDSNAARLRVLAAGLDHEVSEEVPEGLPALASRGAACAEALRRNGGASDADRRAVASAAANALSVWCATHGEGRQEASLQMVRRALAKARPDSAGGDLLGAVERTAPGEGPGWAAALALTVLDNGGSAGILPLWQALADELAAQAAADRDEQFVPALLQEGRDAVAAAEGDEAKEEAAREALRKLSELNDGQILKLVRAANRDPNAAAPSIEADGEQVHIGDVTVRRRNESDARRTAIPQGKA